MIIKLEYEDTDKDVAFLAIRVVDYWLEVDALRELIRGNVKYGNNLTIEQIYEEICRIQNEYKLP